MPFGLTGAPSTFQRLMDKVLRGLPFVTIYIDDILVHSATEQQHCQHLQEVFDRLTAAGLTLRDKKCHIGMTTVSYLGHTFSETGMAPDPQKVQAVHDWPTPTDSTAVRQFLGLASYYRRYIHRFADIAAPLHAVTKKGVTFVWTQECTALSTSFNLPQIHSRCQVVLQTDASAVGLGAVLYQEGHVVAYTSRSLAAPERQYSIIQKECLAVVYALKQFCHYLPGHHFQILTDHAPLQWLSAQKMEGILCCWALAIQEYDFHIVYRKGSLNANADALSCTNNTPCAITLATPHPSTTDLHSAQLADPCISKVLQARAHSELPPQDPDWRQHPLRQYRQLWTQLKVVDGVHA